MDKSFIANLLTDLYTRTVNDNKEDMELIMKQVATYHSVILSILIGNELITLEEYKKLLENVEKEMKQK